MAPQAKEAEYHQSYEMWLQTTIAQYNAAVSFQDAALQGGYDVPFLFHIAARFDRNGTG